MHEFPHKLLNDLKTWDLKKGVNFKKTLKLSAKA